MTLTALGVDVGKHTLAAAGIDGSNVCFESSLPNTLEGIEQMLDALRRTHGSLEGVPCVVEATGGYHLLVASMFARAHVAVKVVNPLETAKLSRQSVRGAKTDRIDAKLLAGYAPQVLDRPSFVPDSAQLSASAIVSSLRHLESIRQSLAMHLSRRKELGSFGGATLVLPEAEAALSAINRQIEALRDAAVACTNERTLSLADTAPGLSRRQVGVLSCFITGREFPSADALVAFFGLDVRKRESGSWRGRERLSKRGNPYARKVLYQIAWGLVRYHPTYRAYCLKKKAEGLHHHAAVCATARKFLRAYWAVCLRDTEGVPVLR